MRKNIINIIFIVGLISLSTLTLVHAYRIPKPQRITDFDQNGLVILNEVLEQLWDVTNGRYGLNTVTSNPDGTLSGKGGDMILYNASGTYYLAINVSGSKVWRSILLTDVP